MTNKTSLTLFLLNVIIFVSRLDITDLINKIKIYTNLLKFTPIY